MPEFFKKGNPFRGFRAIFYTWLIPADAARPEISGIPYYGNS